MKTLGTISLAPLLIGLAFAVFGLMSLWREGFGLLQWGLAGLAVLLVGVILATLFNFAVFAPVYWFLGKRHSKKIKTERAKTTPENAL
jgi:uncharacterized BrkB/YihY/UPF0761 family membrane protein